MILVPFKNLDTAKQRLAPVLDAGQRRALAAAMLEDVLAALAAWRERPAVSLVTGDPHAQQLARRYGFEVILDSENPGETGAIAAATRICEENGIETTLVIPADIPLLDAADLAAMYSAAPPRGVVIAPDAQGRGSNAILRRPAGIIPLRFGDDSFAPHRRAAEAAGATCVVLDLPSVALDVDRPPDLSALLAAPGDTLSQRLLRSWNIAARLQATAAPISK